MTTLREAAQQALNTFESMGHEDSIFAGEFDEIITALRTALQTPPPPPEAQTDGEKNAYHYGWWAAMEAFRVQRTEPEQEPLTDDQAEAVWDNWCLDKKSGPLDLIRAIERAHGIGGEE